MLEGHAEELGVVRESVHPARSRGDSEEELLPGREDHADLLVSTAPGEGRTA